MFVTVDQFLHEHESRGPLERPSAGTEFESYASFDLDIRFLLALARQREPLMHIVCIPDFVLCWHGDHMVAHTSAGCPIGTDLQVRAGVVATDTNTKHPLLWFPDGAVDAICRCAHPFVVCNFGLYPKTDLLQGHANALVFDVKRRVIERYEPMGRADKNDTLDRVLKTRFETMMGKGWTYYGTLRSAPRRGAQAISDAFAGLCVTYSLMYVLLRLLNPTQSATQIQKQTVQGNVRRTALRLNKTVIETLRRYPKGILSRHGSGHIRTRCAREVQSSTRRDRIAVGKKGTRVEKSRKLETRLRASRKRSRAFPRH